MDTQSKSSTKGEVGMKDFTFEQLVIASSVARVDTNDTFVDSVMSEIRKGSSLSNRLANEGTVRKVSLFRRLRRLPAFAILAIAIIGALTITGTVYAITQLWLKPIVHTDEPVKNASGRLELSASLQNCGVEAKQQTIEIKQRSTIDDPVEVSKILQARCERNAIAAVVSPVDRPPVYSKTPDNGDAVEYSMVSPEAYRVISLTRDNIKLNHEVSPPMTFSFKVASETKYFVNNQEVSSDKIHPGDTVLYVMFTKNRLRDDTDPDRFTANDSELEKKITYLIKTDLPIEYYGSKKQNQLARRAPCYGNLKDSCVEGGGIDLYENYKRVLVPEGNTMREVQIKLTSIEGSKLIGTSSSGRVFTTDLPTDPIETFNTTKSSSYNNTIIGIGDTLLIRYSEPMDQENITIDPGRVAYVGLVIEIINKNDPIKKY
jgi:hypothetical protein